MKILLLTSSDICACINLNLLLPTLAEKHEISVMISNYEFAEERASAIANQKMYFEKDYIRKKLFPLIDKEKYTKENRPEYLSFYALSQYYGIDFIEIDRIKAKETIYKHTKRFMPDVIFCCRFEYILKDEVLDLATIGSYNIHSGLLPECAGPDAAFWSMYNKWEYTGCTLHKINNFIDQGNIIICEKVRLDYTKGVIWNRIASYKIGIKNFIEVIEKIEKNEELVSYSQNMTIRCYYHSPNEEQIKKLYTPEFFQIEAGSFKEIIRKFLNANTIFLLDQL